MKTSASRRTAPPPPFRLLFVALLLLVSCGVPDVDGPDWLEPTTPTAAPARMPPRLHVDGADLRDDAGHVVKLRGVNVCSLEFDSTGANWDGAIAVLSDPTRWRANAVRMPVNQEQQPQPGQRAEPDHHVEHARQRRGRRIAGQHHALTLPLRCVLRLAYTSRA